MRVFLMVLALAGCGGVIPEGSGDSESEITFLKDAYRINKVRQVSSHNSYDEYGVGLEGLIGGGPGKPSLEKQLDAGVRSFEFDLHNKSWGWAVYHVSDVFSGGDYCDDLEECIDRLANWGKAHRGHEPITIWLEIKDGFDNGVHSPAALDQRILQDLGGLVYGPQHHMKKCPQAKSLSASMRIPECGWPTIGQLRNMFMVVLHGDNGPLRRYLQDVQDYSPGIYGANGYVGRKLSWVGPEIKAASEMDAWVQAAFFNLPKRAFMVGAEVNRRSLMSRMYEIESQDEWTVSRLFKIHHIATEHAVRERFTPLAVWSDGTPFQRLEE
jgi:hypothetical protein